MHFESVVDFGWTAAPLCAAGLQKAFQVLGKNMLVVFVKLQCASMAMYAEVSGVQSCSGGFCQHANANRGTPPQQAHAGHHRRRGSTTVAAASSLSLWYLVRALLSQPASLLFARQVGQLPARWMG